MRIFLLLLLSVTLLRAQAPYESLLLLSATSAAVVDSPDDIANLFAWYKADALVTNTSGASPPSNADTIMAWGDSSGNGRHLRTNRPATPPTWEAAATTGKAQGGMEHPSSGSLAVGFTALPNTTIFIVWRNPASAGVFVFPQDSTNSSARQAVYKSNANEFGAFAGSAAVGGAAQQNTWYIQAAVFNSGGNDSLYTNHVAVSTALTAGTASLDGLTIGTDNTGGFAPGNNGWIGEVVIYSRNLTTTEIEQVHVYLNTRWAIY